MRLTNAWPLLLVVGWGCAQPAEIVTVRLEDVPPVPAVDMAPGHPAASAQAGFSASTVGTKGERVSPPDVSEKIDDAIASIRTEQERLTRERIRRETRNIAIEYEGLRRDVLAGIREERVAAYQSIEDMLQNEVETRAPGAGWWRSGIAWRLGWPDPDPNAKRRFVQRDGFSGLARADIDHMEAVLASLEDDAVTNLNDILAARRQDALFELAQEELGRQLEAEADISLEVERDFADVGVAPSVVGRSLPPVQPQSVSGSVNAQLPPGRPLNVNISRTLDRDLERFLAARGYRLAGAWEKGRDVTADFIQWRAKMSP